MLSQGPCLLHGGLCRCLSFDLPAVQNKKARKRLARALCDIPTGALQLLPYYARIIATLSQVFPDILQGEQPFFPQLEPSLPCPA